MDKTPIALKDLVDHLYDALSLKMHKCTRESPILIANFRGYKFRRGGSWFRVAKTPSTTHTEYSVTLDDVLLLRTIRNYKDASTVIVLGDTLTPRCVPLINTVLDHAGSNYVVIDEGDPRSSIVITPDMIRG